LIHWRPCPSTLQAELIEKDRRQELLRLKKKRRRMKTTTMTTTRTKMKMKKEVTMKKRKKKTKMKSLKMKIKSQLTGECRRNLKKTDSSVLEKICGTHIMKSNLTIS
jgi:hypothetical protein